MSFLDDVTKVLGVISGLFSVLASLYAFVRWLRGKREKAEVAPTLEAVPLGPDARRGRRDDPRWPADEVTGVGREAVTRRRRPDPPPRPGPALWPWVLGGGVLLLWLLFFAALGLSLVLARPTSPPPLDLTGRWVQPDGNVVLITQQGQQVTLRVPYLEAMGQPPAFTTAQGTVTPSPDPRYQAVLSVSNAGMTAQFYVNADGNHLEGTVHNGFQVTPWALTRR
jgi:hypothetical protein